jgi:hypothetical protein
VTLELQIRPEAEQDMRDLGSAALQLEAAKLLLRLEQDPRFRGLPLDVHPTVGDLSDCRKLLFNNARHRIVFRLLRGKNNSTIADIIAIGPRANLAVYEQAVRRLGRDDAAA